MLLPYIVMYNQDSDFWTGYTIGDVLVNKFTGTIEVDIHNCEEALEWLFSRYNVGSGVEDTAALAAERSLSVGDVVVLGEVAFACGRQGWTSVPLPINFAS